MKPKKRGERKKKDKKTFVEKPSCILVLEKIQIVIDAAVNYKDGCDCPKNLG
jgi:hypothetical protein